MFTWKPKRNRQEKKSTPRKKTKKKQRNKPSHSNTRLPPAARPSNYADLYGDCNATRYHHNYNAIFVHQGLRSPFTEVPIDPTYFAAGSDARLKWNFIIQGSFKRVEIEYETSGSWVTLVTKDQGGSVAKNPSLPNSLTSRITIEGNATLVISAVNTGDSTKYKCAFVPLSGSRVEEGLVQLIVTGEQ